LKSQVKLYAGIVSPTPDPQPDPEPRWLDQQELDCWKSVMAMLMNLPAALDAQLQRDAKLSLFTYLVMVALSDAPERTLPMSRIAAMAHGSLSRLSHAVASLERRGWVVRRAWQENGRITVATLTDAGVEKLRAAAPGHIAAVRALVLDPLQPAGLFDFRDCSRAILEQLDVPWRSIGSPDTRSGHIPDPNPMAEHPS
jgi:DNA-binding MarR family transcriptional regulator